MGIREPSKQSVRLLVDAGPKVGHERPKGYPLEQCRMG